MAKKTSKKAATKSSKKMTSKPAGKKPASKGKSAKKDPFAPVPVSTGKGSSAAEIGRDLVAHFNAGKPDKELWAKHFNFKVIESIEGVGVGMKWVGGKAVEGKNQYWAADHVVHGGRAEGPFVGSTGFAVRFTVDVETKSTRKREIMHEIGVYTVQDGKIVREEFMYAV